MINTNNGIGISDEEIVLWIAKAQGLNTFRQTWPGKSKSKSFSGIRMFYKSEEDYPSFAWEQFIQGHKIWQIFHLDDCVRVVLELYGRKIRKEWVK